MESNSSASLEKMSPQKEVTSEDSENMDADGSDADNSISGDSNLSESEKIGNLAWADAMSRVLNAKVKDKKNFILSKAKKDADIKEKKKDEIQMVDESGNVLQTLKPDAQSTSEGHKEKRKKMLEKEKQKLAWESLCRVKPDITQKDREKELVRIATRGIVHLFNTVEKHQKAKKSQKEKTNKEKSKRKESLGAVKGNFMDILKGHSRKELTSEADPAMKKTKHEETWSILKDDFMMGAEMKDWDKESDNDK